MPTAPASPRCRVRTGRGYHKGRLRPPHQSEERAPPIPRQRAFIYRTIRRSFEQRSQRASEASLWTPRNNSTRRIRSSIARSKKKETLGTGQRPSSGYDIRVPRDGGVGNLRPFAAPSVIRRNGSALLGRHHLTRRSATLVHSYLPKSAWKRRACAPKRILGSRAQVVAVTAPPGRSRISSPMNEQW